jgi:hypothetical protein
VSAALRGSAEDEGERSTMARAARAAPAPSLVAASAAGRRRRGGSEARRRAEEDGTAVGTRRRGLGCGGREESRAMCIGRCKIFWPTWTNGSSPSGASLIYRNLSPMHLTATSPVPLAPLQQRRASLLLLLPHTPSTPQLLRVREQQSPAAVPAGRLAGDGAPPRGPIAGPVPGAWDGHGRVAVSAMQRRAPAREQEQFSPVAATRRRKR